MKDQIDFQTSLSTELILNKKWKYKFLKAWKTEMKGGVLVFKERTYLYYEGGLDSDDRLSRNRVCKLFGIDRKSMQFGGQHEVWLYLRKNRKPNLDFYDRNILALKINSFFTVDETRTMRITIADSNDPYKFNGWSKEQIWTYLDNNYENVLNENIIVSKGDKLLDCAIGKYVLLDDGTYFNVVSQRAIITPVAKVRIQVVDGVDKEIKYYESSINVDIKITRKDTFTENSPIVNAMITTTDPIEMQYIQSLIDSDHDRLESEGFVDVTTIGDVTSPVKKISTPTYNSLWHHGQLRVDACTNASLLQSREFVKLIMSTLDYNSTPQKSTKGERWLMPITFVIALVLAIFTGGQSLTLWAAVFIATTVSLIVMMIAAKTGATAAGVKTMGKWVQGFNVVLTLIGIGVIIQGVANAGTEAAKQAAIQGANEAGQAAAADAATSLAINNTLTGAAAGAAVGAGMSYATSGKIDPMSTVSGAVSGGMVGTSATSDGMSITDYVLSSMKTSFELSFESVKRYLSMALKVIETFTSWQTKNEAKALKGLTEEYTERQRLLDEEQSLMADQGMHVGIEYIKNYTKPLTLQNLQFEVDYLYEPTKDNMCRGSFNTVKGLNIRSNDIFDTRL